MNAKEVTPQTPDPSNVKKCNYGFILFVLAEEAIIIGTFARISYPKYPYGLNSSSNTVPGLILADENDWAENQYYRYYLLFMYINTFCLIGFSFLTVYLRFHRWSSLGFSYISIALAAQLYILFSTFWIRVMYQSWPEFYQIQNIQINASIKAAVGLLIAFGALLGKIDLFQTLVLGTIFMFIYCLNEVIVMALLTVRDTGGCFTIHAFSAFFGVACTFVYSYHTSFKGNPNSKGSYSSYTMAFIGTFFLWIMFQAFNCTNLYTELFGLEYAKGTIFSNPYSLRIISIINTFWCLTASTVTTYIISFRNSGHKLNVDHILNATLSGGVAIAASSDLFNHVIHPMYIGAIAGIISTLSYRYFTRFYERFHIFDTRGVLTLHGWPSLLGAIASAIAASQAAGMTFNKDNNISLVMFAGRSPLKQGGYQFAGWAISLGIGLGGGIITGFVLRIWKLFNLPEDTFGDQLWWVMEIDKVTKMKPLPDNSINASKIDNLN